MKLKLCFISHSSGGGGAEKSFPKLLKHLKEKGIDVYVLLPSRGQVTEILEDYNIPYKIIPYKLWMSRKPNIWGKIKRTFLNMIMIIPVSIEIFKSKCNIVYTNTCTVCVGGFSSKILNKPHIWHFREFGYEDHGFIYDFGEKFSLWITGHLSTLCIANSKSVAEKYAKYISNNKLKVIYEAYFKDDKTTTNINLCDKQEQPIDLRCIIVGSLFKNKGHIDAIYAVNELILKEIKTKLYIVGEGDSEYKKSLTDLIYDLNLEHDVIFMGYIDDPQSLMKQCNMLLMCSQKEAFGLVTIEAMQIGIPVIGTNSGGTTEIIEDGFNGLLYNPGDFQELSKKIELLYRNPVLSKKLSENAKQSVNKKFNPEKYILETLNTINDIMNLK